MFLPLKLLLTSSLILLALLGVQAQSISRSAIGATGIQFHQGTISLQSIVGQSSLTINRHGFIQPHGVGDRTKLPTRLFSLYPNPTKSESIISGVAKGDRISLFSLDGKLIKSFACQSFVEQSISLNSLPNGAYIIIVSGVFNYPSLKLIKTD